MRQPGDTRQDRAVIGRYTRPEMGHVWSEEHKLRLWCRIETLVLEAHARAGTIPASAVEPVRNAPPPTPGAVAAVEAVTGHDVIAFLSAWADNTQPREAAAYVHYGMTSSDLLDTALALQLTEASELLVAGCDALTAALREHALATGTRSGWAALTASTPSRTSGVTGSRTSRSPRTGAPPGCAGPGTRWPSASSPGLSAPTPTSTRRSRPR